MTGAAGKLGHETRQGLAGEYELIRLSDIAAMAPAGAGEEVVTVDLADAAGVAAMCEGMDAIVHFGGQPREADWATVKSANIEGAINLWEGARIHGVDRVIFASSNHAVGLYRREERLDHTTPARPDSRYGLSKAFGEDISALYAYKWGVKGFCMRIGSCFPAPVNERALHTWHSYGDIVRLVRAGLTADYVYEIVYGVSDNRDPWWDNTRARELGYAPQDTAEAWRDEVADIGPTNAIDGAFHGGPFVSDEFTADPDKVP
ncbi:MAG: NAD(P)-dependent oxidoreductase [Acuticoccus sp.]